MFVFMNAARLGVGMQGLGLTEVAYQNALIYAKDRIQMRSLSGLKHRTNQLIQSSFTLMYVVCC